MKKNIFFILFLSFLMSLSATLPAWAEETKTQTEQKSAFALEVKDNLINLRAEQASCKEILADLAKKTGIKVNIFEGVEDKNVTMIRRVHAKTRL